MLTFCCSLGSGRWHFKQPMFYTDDIQTSFTLTSDFRFDNDNGHWVVSILQWTFPVSVWIIVLEIRLLVDGSLSCRLSKSHISSVQSSHIVWSKLTYRLSRSHISSVQISHIVCSNLTYCLFKSRIPSVQISHTVCSNLTYRLSRSHISSVQISHVVW